MTAKKNYDFLVWSAFEKYVRIHSLEIFDSMLLSSTSAGCNAILNYYTVGNSKQCCCYCLFLRTLKKPVFRTPSGWYEQCTRGRAGWTLRTGAANIPLEQAELFTDDRVTQSAQSFMVRSTILQRQRYLPLSIIFVATPRQRIYKFVTTNKKIASKHYYSCHC